MSVTRTDSSQRDARPAGESLVGKEFLLAKRDSSGNFVLAGSGDIVAGVIAEGKAATYWSTVITGGLAKVIAGEAITEGVKVAAGANGTTVAGTTNSFGVSRNQVSSGEMLEVMMDQS